MTAKIIQFPEPKKYWFNVSYLDGGKVSSTKLHAVSVDECKKAIERCGFFLFATRV